jgi:putative addiction module antidote
MSMTIKLKVTTIGSSAGVILPREALAHLGVREGDDLYLVATPDGYRLSPNDPDFEEQLESARKGMDACKNTLRALAR